MTTRNWEGTAPFRMRAEDIHPAYTRFAACGRTYSPLFEAEVPEVRVLSPDGSGEGARGWLVRSWPCEVAVVLYGQQVARLCDLVMTFYRGAERARVQPVAVAQGWTPVLLPAKRERTHA